MPLLTSTYKGPPILPGGHPQTIWPALFRRPPAVTYERERLFTRDGDFLDIDWLRRGSRRLAILSSGVEGNTESVYMKATAAYLSAARWDVLGWNYRGCSGTINWTARTYHAGDTGDLREVIQHAGVEYHQIALIGFSMGGNLMLKYLGEDPEAVHPRVTAAVAFSAPCDLAAAAARLSETSNRVYMRYFMRSLTRKIEEKARAGHDIPDLEGLRRIRTFREFDGRFIGPLRGFSSAEDYWKQCSSLQFLPAIKVPVLLISARNDPFLSPTCFPTEEATASRRIFLETPDEGGHLGFPPRFLRRMGCYWSEQRAGDFLSEMTGFKETGVASRAHPFSTPSARAKPAPGLS